MSFRRLFFAVLPIAFSAVIVHAQAPVNFDDNWKFYSGGCLGAEEVRFNDSAWRIVDLPHDWSIEDRKNSNTPFSAEAINQVGGGFTTGGTGWYRKKFRISNADRNKILYLRFDGVYMNADIWINGKHLGNHPYGYTGFSYNITPYLVYDSSNLIAVEVKNEGQNSRWYSGSGIYRHVWMKTVDSVHIGIGGTGISTGQVSVASAAIHISTPVVNEGKTQATCEIITRLFDNRGSEIGQTQSRQILYAGETRIIHSDEIVPSPALWSCERPDLYSAQTSVYQNGKIIQIESVSFGIRKISFDAMHGFRLNDIPLKLKGGCMHHDNGPLGSRAYDRAEERKVEILKQAGYNAIRCSHNPPSPALLNACDRIGMLVIDEAFDMWNIAKTPYDYHLYFNDWWKQDIESMVLRDRNHPSVILWSIGNEIPDMEKSAVVSIAGQLASFIKTLDTTRLVTAAVNGLNIDKDSFFSKLDVGGYNYAAGNDHIGNSSYESDHRRVPERIMVGTESYPLDAFASWMEVEDNPYVIGDFVWTAFDYIGEASIGWLGYYQKAAFFPWNLAYCGDFDICGGKRAQSYYRDVLWKKNQLSIFVTPPQPSFPMNQEIESWSRWNWNDVVREWNWTGNEQRLIDVYVYSSCARVELFLNGKSLGVQATSRPTQFTAHFRVPYQPGTLRAAGYNGDDQTPLQTDSLTTAGKVEKLRLQADRTHLQAGIQDLSYITVSLHDAKGRRNPVDDRMIDFDITGDARIVGVGNGNPVSLESYQQPRRKTWKGQCLVIIKAGRQKGIIRLTATSAGTKPASVELIAE